MTDYIAWARRIGIWQDSGWFTEDEREGLRDEVRCLENPQCCGRINWTPIEGGLLEGINSPSLTDLFACPDCIMICVDWRETRCRIESEHREKSMIARGI